MFNRFFFELKNYFIVRESCHKKIRECEYTCLLNERECVWKNMSEINIECTDISKSIKSKSRFTFFFHLLKVFFFPTKNLFDIYSVSMFSLQSFLYYQNKQVFYITGLTNIIVKLLTKSVRYFYTSYVGIIIIGIKLHMQ